MIEITNFQQFINQEYALVDFSATWCGPCKMLHPILDKLSDKYVIGKLDVDKFSDIATNYQVITVPTLILFKKGEIIDTKNGILSQQQIVEWLDAKIF